MRRFGYCLIGLLAVAAPAPAQENLDTVLRGWEKSMTDLKNFVCEVNRESLDKALQAKDTFKGYAMFVKPATKNDGSRARLELAKTTNAKVFEKYICTGIYLYEYAPANNVVRVHDMPQNKQGNNQQESFLSFLFGMGSEQAKTRYQMELIVPKTPDKFYHYIRVQPKLAQDKGDFTEARLSLYRANNLPAQIWYHQPNGNEITWNFSKVQTNLDKLSPDYFQPDVPKGWRVERVQPKTPVAVTPTVRGGTP
jgi:TIGR03009 family protein